MLEIIIHQIKDDFKSLKFLISLVLILVLFILNGLFFSLHYQEKQEEYAALMIENREYIKNTSWSLSNLVYSNFQVIKSPLESEFIVSNKQNALPGKITVNIDKITMPEMLNYWRQTDGLLMDWLFIISVVCSFLIFIATYNSISEERERGTLKLVFSTSISNLTFVLGKLSGIVFSFFVALLLGVVLNIFIITAMNKIPINGELLGNISLFLFASVIYILLFASIGLFVSLISKTSLISLIVLSLIWIIFAFITPLVSRVATLNFYETATLTEFENKYNSIDQEFPFLVRKHDGATRSVETGKIDDYKKEKGYALALAELAENKQEIQDQYFKGKIDQAIFYENLCKVSPIYFFTFMIENMFNSGIQRDINLVRQAKDYQNLLISYFKEVDKEDKKSPNVHFIKSFLSKKNVDSSQVPEFQENKYDRGFIKLYLSNLLLLIVELIIITSILCMMFIKRSLC
jgi:ABC-type transport system involved in multi-copper enzyme maturation permease subunit